VRFGGVENSGASEPIRGVAEFWDSHVIYLVDDPDR